MSRLHMAAMAIAGKELKINRLKFTIKYLKAIFCIDEQSALVTEGVINRLMGENAILSV